VNKRKIGSKYEVLAGVRLREEGYEILEENYRCQIGEIDIIAKEKEYLVFIEVKYRKDAARGIAVEAVNKKKQGIIRKVASYYLMEHHLGMDTPCRFDVVGITGEQLQLIRNAF